MKKKFLKLGKQYHFLTKHCPFVYPFFWTTMCDTRIVFIDSLLSFIRKYVISNFIFYQTSLSNFFFDINHFNGGYLINLINMSIWLLDHIFSYKLLTKKMSNLQRRILSLNKRIQNNLLLQSIIMHDTCTLNTLGCASFVLKISQILLFQSKFFITYNNDYLELRGWLKGNKIAQFITQNL